MPRIEPGMANVNKRKSQKFGYFTALNYNFGSFIIETNKMVHNYCK